jgi:predicted O-linked N-acetylglucosamine transferase (SPINDLY family)
LLASLLLQGERLREEGRPDKALVPLERAVRLAPRLARGHVSQGLALVALDRKEDAEAAFRQAIAVQPDQWEGWSHLGTLLCRLGRNDEGVEAHRRACELTPGSPALSRNLATALRLAGRYDEALQALERAIALNPDFALAWVDLGILYRDRRRADAAVEACDRAIGLAADNPLPHRVKAHALFQAGRWREAEAAYDKALERWPGDWGMRICRALLLPLIPEDREEMAMARALLISRLAEIAAAPDLKLDDPYQEVGITNFYLAYQGEDDRAVQESLAALFLKACPALGWTAPHCSRPRRREGPARIGFLSANLTPGHTIAKLFAGLLRHLPRDRFTTVLLRPQGQKGLEELADRQVSFPLALGEARRIVAAEELDVLVYPDIGMDAFTYYLAFARLAPVQCATYGHPVTSGIPNMDWFLGAADLDPPGNERHYSERLARLETFAIHPPRPDTSGLAGRPDLGLPEDRRLYVCAQTLFKLHPDFDFVLADILRRDELATIVLIEGGHQGLAERLRRRLERRLPGGTSRVLFLPSLDSRRFLGLLAAADVLLDSFPFCGGNTSLEAFAVGAPVVTLSSGLMRGRVTEAFYRRMGIGDLIAADVDGYVELALRVAMDRDWRREISARIAERAPILFEPESGAAALAAFLDDVLSRPPGVEGAGRMD